MTSARDETITTIDETARQALGLTLEELRLLPERSIAGAAAMLARRAGVD